MTYGEFTNLKDGVVLYNAVQSRRYGKHITALVRGHDKCGGGIKLYSEGMEETVPYCDYLLFDVMPEDTSQLPFY